MSEADSGQQRAGGATLTSLIEGYYVESIEGLLFAVKGLVHPPEAVVAYLRYAPDPAGQRTRGDIRYSRLYRFKEQEQLLHSRFPSYLFFDPVFGERLQGVPLERIGAVYDPCSTLATLARRENLDELQHRAVEFATLLVRRARVPEKSVGISGSILVSLHKPHSDVDLVVYGSRNCQAVYEALQELLEEPGGDVRRLNEKEMKELYALRSQDTPMAFEDFATLERRKAIEGKFRDCQYFIRFVKAPEEAGESYGDRTYTVLGSAEIEATVADASEAIFTPCAYRLAHVQLAGQQHAVPPPMEIVSFRGRFCEQTKEGERVIAKGKLERVVTSDGRICHRLLLGRPGDSMTVEAG